MLSEKEFNVLVYLTEKPENVTQNKIAQNTGMSLGKANMIIKDLIEKDYIHKYEITKKGLEALEPYRVKNACLLAAGFGSRLVPITLNTPKPLIRVFGTRIIDTLIDACLQAEIPNIYVVRGYLKEEFDLLKNKYPMIHLIDNPLYNETNNISSALLLGDKVINSYMFEADIYLKNPKLITKYQYHSNYLGIFKEKTDDYILNVENGRIISGGIGGFNVYQQVGISYWNEEAGTYLMNNIKETFYNVPGGKERFFGSCGNLKKFYFAVRECKQEDVIEIDTFKELQALDSAYTI